MIVKFLIHVVVTSGVGDEMREKTIVIEFVKYSLNVQEQQ